MAGVNGKGKGGKKKERGRGGKKKGKREEGKERLLKNRAIHITPTDFLVIELFQL